MKHSEEVAWRYSVKMVFLEILQNSQRNSVVEVSFLKKLNLRPATLFKKDSSKVFSHEFWEISKNTFL